eukprot:SAG11_NODE_682_length_7769_cov_45.167275_12_plen_114_part_00
MSNLQVDGQAAVETWFESNRPAKKAKGAASSGGGAKKAGAAGGGKQKMRRPEIGETLYQCGYALSGRAKCKACGEKIEQVRVSRANLVSIALVIFIECAVGAAYSCVPLPTPS